MRVGIGLASGVLVASFLVPFTGCGNPCGPGTELSNGKCVPAAPPCGTGTHRVGDKCVAGAECGPGTVNQNGACVPVNATCGKGTILVNGKCVPDDGIAATSPWSANSAVVQNGNGDYRAEVSLAVDPQGGVHAAYTAIPSSTGTGVVQVASRAPGDTAFAAPVAMDTTSLRGGGSFYEGDPSTVVDSNGRLHVSWAEYYSDPSLGVVSDVATAYSDDGGATFSTTVRVNTGGNAVFNDRPWLAAGPSGAVYISWYSQSSSAYEEHFAASNDGGDTFTQLTPVTIYTSTEYLVPYDSPLIATSSSELMLAAIRYGSSGEDATVVILVSEDGGSTWNENDTLVPVYVSRDLQWGMRPQLVKGQNGVIYLAYINAPAARMGVFVSRSDDDGFSFNAPVEVSGDYGSVQTLSWMDVDASNVAHVVWLDSRDGDWKLLYRSTDGSGNALGPLEAVSDTTFPGSTSYLDSNNPWLGDFLGFAVEGGRGYAVWTDNRGAQPDIYFSEAQLQ